MQRKGRRRSIQRIWNYHASNRLATDGVDRWSYVNSRFIPILADVLLKPRITDEIIAVCDRTVRMADEIF